MMSTSEVNESGRSISGAKLQHYEYFLNDVLRTDLGVTLERRDKLFTQIAEFMELQRVLETIISPEDKTKPSVRTKVDLGCNFYVQAEVEHLSQISVDIGCGIWLPMSPVDAKKFSERQIAYLNKRVERLTEEEVALKAKIQVVMAALQELNAI